MAQEINETGTLVVPVTKNVIFKKQAITNITITEGDICTISFTKTSSEGEKNETIAIPFTIFEELIEPYVWEAINSTNSEGEE